MNHGDRFDAIVIGTGQAGKPLARSLAAAGRRTAIVESGHIGGTCVNVGCTPTKAMVASARIAHLGRRSIDYGVDTGTVRVDLQRVVERKRSIVQQFRDGSGRRLEETPGLELIRGRAKFIEPHAVEVRGSLVADRVLEAESIFINTGGNPAIPSVVKDADFLTSSTIMELEEVPAHLIVLGGGYVGSEFGQMFRRFGSEVTILQRADCLLTREDEDVCDAVAEIFREDGIELWFGADVIGVERQTADGGTYVVTARVGGEEREVYGSHLLVATGRIPNTSGLGLDEAGIATDDRGFVLVNERLETNVPGIYALGDVNGGPAFTHIAYDDYRVIESNLLGTGGAGTASRLVPYTVFIDPELGRVGLSEWEAAEMGRPIRVAKLPMTNVARAIERGETRGFMKAVVDRDTDEILGCAMLGIEGGETMSALQVAMMGGLPYTALRDGVFAHPTLAESLNNLFMAMDT
jgi:pyruvate/2-oxoglutarate dehydrogenase complex dihydrolipoamide dehydrogenase (E3) component